MNLSHKLTIIMFCNSKKSLSMIQSSVIYANIKYDLDNCDTVEC